MSAADFPDLLAEHYEQLSRGSGISDAVIQARGYFSIKTNKDNHRLEQAGFALKQRRPPGLALPMHMTDGQPGPCAFRSDHPRLLGGKWMKYEQPEGVGLRVDCPPLCLPNLAKPGIPLWITEGVKKGDALASRDYTTIDLSGVWGFVGKNMYGAVTVQVDFRYIGWSHRDVRIVFDSDVMTKQGVYRALLELTELLERKGASVKHIYLPPGPGGEKVGVDDFLVAHADNADLDALVNAPAPKMEPQRPAIEIVDALPLKLDRPLQTIDGHAYAYAPLVPVSVTESEIIDPTTGRLLVLDEPRVTVTPVPLIVRDDGEVYGFPGGPGFERLPFDLDMRGEESIVPELWWAPSGVRAFLAGTRPDPTSLAKRLVQAFDAFVDFSGSLAEQAVMCRVLACEALATWLIDQLDTAPYVHTIGEFEAGKTRAIEVLVALSYLGQLVLKSTTFPVLRDVADFGGALGIDEAEVAREGDEDLNKRSLILNGYRRSGTTIAHNTPSPNGAGWLIWRSRTFSSRFFASIGSPDSTQASRSFIVPMIRSNDPLRTTKAPAAEESWPFARRDLTSDLWAWGLTHLPLVRSAWDRVPAAMPTLGGREMEVWRPALTAALLLEDDGVTGMTSAITQVMGAYRREKDELADDIDLNRLIVMAIAGQLFDLHNARPDMTGVTDICDITRVGLADCTITMVLWASEVTERIGRLRDELGTDLVAGDLSSRQVGRRLVKPLRLGKSHSDGKRRGREVRASALERLFITHNVDYPHMPPRPIEPDLGSETKDDGADSSSSGRRDPDFGVPPKPNVSHVNNVITSVPTSVGPPVPPPADISDVIDVTDIKNGVPPESSTTTTTWTSSNGTHARADPSSAPAQASKLLPLYPTPPYKLITTAYDLVALGQAMLRADERWVGSDTETTGLRHHLDRMRLVPVAWAHAGEVRVAVIHLNHVTAEQVADAFRALYAAADGPKLAFHNALFDGRWFTRLGLPIPTGARLFDTMTAARIVDARGNPPWRNGGYGGYAEEDDEDEPGPGKLRFRLSDLVERHLGFRLPKKEQNPKGWQKEELSQEQLDYAARDAAATLELAQVLDRKLREQGLTNAMDLDMTAYPMTISMADEGVPVVRDIWLEPSRAAIPKRDRLVQEMNELAVLPSGTTKVWNSTRQLPKLLAARGIDLPNTQEATLKAYSQQRGADPLIGLLLAYKATSKPITAYGEKLLDKWLTPEGRIHPGWNVTGTDTGRMSCSNPSWQTIPRDKPGQPSYRRAVRAPEGWLIVKGDYSQLQIRISAHIAQDEAMLAAYADPDTDFHIQTAAKLYGVPYEEIGKDDPRRQMAKGVVFGLLFGSASLGLQYYLRDKHGLDVTRAKAGEFRDKFYRAYLQLKRRMEKAGLDGKAGRPPTDIYDPSCSGRRRLAVHRSTERLNTPVQMVEAHGFKLLLARLWETHDEVPRARPFLVVHDEMDVLCPEGDHGVTAAWLEREMVAAMQPLIPSVPVVVDIHIGRTWAMDDDWHERHCPCRRRFNTQEETS